MTKKNDSINFDKLSIDPDAPVISPEAAKGDLFTNLSGENPQSDDTSADTVIIDFNEGEKNGQEKCPMCGATDIALNANFVVISVDMNFHPSGWRIPWMMWRISPVKS